MAGGEPDDSFESEPEVCELEKKNCRQVSDVARQLSQFRFSQDRTYLRRVSRKMCDKFVGGRERRVAQAVQYYHVTLLVRSSQNLSPIRKDSFLTEDEGKRSKSLCSLSDSMAAQFSDHDYGTFPLIHRDFGTHNSLFMRNQRVDGTFR